MDYIENIIKLSMELCKASPNIINDYFGAIYSFEFCLHVFLSSNFISSLKSSFIDFFTHSYLSYDCRYIETIHLNECIILNDSENFDENLIINMKYFKNNFSSRGFMNKAQQHFNLKCKYFKNYNNV